MMQSSASGAAWRRAVAHSVWPVSNSLAAPRACGRVEGAQLTITAAIQESLPSGSVHCSYSVEKCIALHFSAYMGAVYGSSGRAVHKIFKKSFPIILPFSSLSLRLLIRFNVVWCVVTNYALVSKTKGRFYFSSRNPLTNRLGKVLAKRMGR